MVELQVKWGKDTFPVTFDPSTGYAGLTQVLEERTSVPVDRMKLMAKSKGLWKGVLKAETVVDWNKAAALSNNHDNSNNSPLQILLMGSATQLSGPVAKTVFVEDLPPEEVAKVMEPAGLTNLGNTCYLNSVVQCLRAIPSFRKGIAFNTNNLTVQTSSNPVHRILIQALHRTLEQLDRQVTALQPFPLVQATQTCFPQFATTGPQGRPQQQDAEEFYSAMLTVAAAETNTAQHLQAALPNTPESDFLGAKNVVDAIFGIQMKETLTCDELPVAKTEGGDNATNTEPPVVSYDLHRKLVCNIQGGGAAVGSTTNITFVQEGIRLSLQGNMEKHSQVLGRNAAWTRIQRIARLPPILTVQFGRFYWKPTPDSQDHAGVKCKIMKPVTFQPILDVYEFCTPEIQKQLDIARKAAAAAEEDRITKKLKGMDDAGEVEPMDQEETKALQVALAMSMDAEDETTPIGPGLPEKFQGLYELFAVVTHKGRDADGGHYMAWVKSDHQPPKVMKIADTDQDNEDWFVYDDDEVSPCKTEDILKLKGGGDWHMSYLNFYRAKK